MLGCTAVSETNVLIERVRLTRLCVTDVMMRVIRWTVSVDTVAPAPRVDVCHRASNTTVDVHSHPRRTSPPHTPAPFAVHFLMQCMDATLPLPLDLLVRQSTLAQHIALDALVTRADTGVPVPAHRPQHVRNDLVRLTVCRARPCGPLRE